MVKFRSRNRAGLMKGFFAVAVWARNTQKAATRRPARVRIWSESNQSSRSPRSMMSCAQVIAMEKARKPVQSSRIRSPRVLSRMKMKARMNAAAQSGRMSRKTQRQLYSSAR